jgi:GNAT superfamily N-acetyltransferase
MPTTGSASGSPPRATSATPGSPDLATGQLADWLAGREEEAAPAPAPGEIDYGELAWRMDIEGLPLLALAGAASRPVGDGYAVRSGVLDNTLNGVVCDACSDAQLAEALAWLDGVPAQWHVSPRSGLHDHLLAVGARPERSGVVMGAEAAGLDLAAGPRVHQVRAVADDAELDAWLGVGEDWSMIEGPEARAAYRRVFAALALGPGARVRMQLAWDDEVAIGAISARRHDDVLLLEQLGVRPGSQRIGVGRALIAAAVAAEPRAVHVVLAPTPSSIPFYDRLGFVLQRFPPDRSYYLPARRDDAGDV